MSTLIQQAAASLSLIALFTMLHYAWRNRKTIYYELTLNQVK